MDNKRNPLYTLGSVTSILGGILVVFSGCWVLFSGTSGFLSVEAGQPPDSSLGVLHGIGVVTQILLVPAVVASYVLLRSEAKIRSLLGALFGLLWIVVELTGHCALTAPLQTLADFMADSETQAIGKALGGLWEEWAEALLMTGTFLCALTAFCYGLALREWGNIIAACLFLLCAIAFPLGVWLGLGIQLHLIFRGIAFIFLGGILLRATQVDDEDWFSSVNF